MGQSRSVYTIDIGKCYELVVVLLLVCFCVLLESHFSGRLPLQKAYFVEKHLFVPIAGRNGCCKLWRFPRYHTCLWLNLLSSLVEIFRERAGILDLDRSGLLLVWGQTGSKFPESGLLCAEVRGCLVPVGIGSLQRHSCLFCLTYLFLFVCFLYST